MISHFQRAGRRDELAYSTERRAAVLTKLEPPNAVPLRQLAKDEGISEATLHAWRRDGVCQRSCPVPHQAASLILRSSVPRSGLRQTSPTGDQLRIWRDHRVGLAARASV